MATPDGGGGGRGHPPDPEQFAARLADKKADIRAKLSCALEIKDLLEVYQNVDYGRFLKHLLPPYMELMNTVPCSFHSDSPEQKLRHTLAETIHRLPHHELVRPFAEDLMRVMLNVLRDDNEENAVVALKVIIDLHRSYKSVLQDHVQPFLELVQAFYNNMKNTVNEAFKSDSAQTQSVPGQAANLSSDSPMAAPSPAAESQGASAAGSEVGAGAAAGQQASKALVKSISSFKVLTECPIAIVLIFQSYRSVVPQAIHIFVPLIVEQCLTLQAKPQQQAHEAARERGDIFVGVAPGIKNRALYTDMVVAQVKTMSFLAYVLRGSAPVMRPYAHLLPEVSVRLLKDCPPESSATRKELLVATRHVLSTEFRAHFVGQIDTLLDERVLIGTGITSHETQRPLAISMLADLVHHVRQELLPAQLVRVVHIHSQILHDATLAPSIQTMCVKLLLNLVETIVTKHPDGASNILRGILDTFVEKLASLHRLKEDVENAKKQREGAPAAQIDAMAIERAKPIQAAAAMVDPVGDPLKDARFLFRNILFGFKTLIPVLKHRNAPEPDGETMGRLFEDGVRCWSLHEQREGREEKEVMDLFTTVFTDLEPQVFHEVFTNNMAFLFEEMLANPILLGIPQNLLSNEVVSRRFVGILLRFLVDRLEELGNADKKYASVSLRLFKMAFMAVTIFPEENEAVLQPHLSHLIMTSMKFASKAAEPTNYFLLLRALFRSIGGGRFELLYKDVLPLLPVLLENLNNLLNAAEPNRRELFVDLCLTVPVRLSVLLPYLGYLMKPLVLALQSSNELVSQGLRTLELCIDNLTQEFLDPIMAPYCYDIMSALWKHLQPLPHNHQHSHTTMRILGKMGGRNRRLLQQAPRLTYHGHKDSMFTIHFDGKAQSLSLAPITDLALANVRRGDAYYRKHSYELLRHAAALFLDGTFGEAERDQAFEKVIKGLFDATRAEDLQEEATKFLLGLSRHVFTLEARRETPFPPGMSTRHLLPLTNAFLEGVVQTLASCDGADATAICDLDLRLVKDLVKMYEGTPPTRPELSSTILHALASRFCSQCYDQLWQRKTGGWMGIEMLTRKADLSQTWVRDHQLEIVRALLFMLKDMPGDPPGNVDDVSATLLHVLRVAYTNHPGRPVWEDKGTQERPSQFSFLVGILVPELSSSNETVRTTTQSAFELLAELKECGVTEILTPGKDRLLGPIFTKPLRALPFGMQIGHIDAITYCLKLRPPLPEFNEELFRVLTEALALADADDQALIGRTSQYKNALAVTNLRVVAIRLLSSAMACTDFFSPKQTQMRMRIISVYFKSLYSRSDAVVQVAYESLKSVLVQQSKLPKDLLQSALRPILMNLADHKRLSASGLDGLARLLELLTNYFKVEIGNKLLDHLRALAEPAVLQRAAIGSLEDDNEIKTMAAIVNIFHLLPPAARQFMSPLLTAVVDIEAELKRTSATPFTKPLAKFLDRYAAEAVEFLFERVDDPKFVRCFRLALASDEAPALREQVTNNKERFLLPLFNVDATDSRRILPGLLIVKEMLKRDETWIVQHSDVFDRLLALWGSSGCQTRRRAETGLPSRQQRESVHLVDVLCTYLKQVPSVEAYFQLLDVFTYKTSVDFTPTLRFIYEHLAMKGNMSLKREIFGRFIQLFEDRAMSQAHKIQSLRVIVNPMLLATFAPKVQKKQEQEQEQKKEGKPEAEEEQNTLSETKQETKQETLQEPQPGDEAKASETVDEELLDANMVTQVVNRIWKPFQNKAVAQVFCADDALRVELLHMSTMIIEHCSHHLPQGQARKDTIKFGWVNITVEDVTVKNAAYVFIARFLDVFESPIKIVGQVYIALLRAHQPEGRAMVRKALDILVPALPKRVGASEGGGPPQWAKWTKRVLTDEGHNLSQLFGILQLLVRHSDLFYSSREMFLPYIAGSLTKLGLMPAASSETRSLTVDLVELVVNWERKRQEHLDAETADDDDDSRPSGEGSATRKRGEGSEDQGARKRARIDRAGSSVSTSTQAAGEHTYTTPMNLREAIIGYLVRFVSLYPEPLARGGFITKAFSLLKELSKAPVWSDVQIKLAIFQRPLIHTEMSETNVHIICNAMQALKVIVEGKSDEWFSAHIAQLHKLLEKSVATEDQSVPEHLRPVVERMFAVLPDAPQVEEDTEDEQQREQQQHQQQQQPVDGATAFRIFAEEAIAEGLRSTTNLYVTFVLLDAWAKAKPEKIDAHLPALIKALTKLTKEHLAAQSPVPATDPGLKLLMMVLDLLKIRISNLQDQRRWFLSALVQLVEKSSSLELCRFILNMMSKWILEQKEAFPTVKEKAGILVKMMSFENRDNDQLLRDYLDLILSIYTTPAFARTELTVRLENAFLLGCRQRDPLLRQRFIDLFDRTLVHSLSGRLQYLLGQQSWEYLAEHYWLHQMLDLLLGSIDAADPLLVQSTSAAARANTDFGQTLRGFTTGSLVQPLRALLYTDAEATHKIWPSFFKAAWRALPRRNQEEVTRAFIGVLTKEYNVRQVSRRPNVIQTLLEGALACTPQLELPPHVVKYLGKSFNAWHPSVELLQNLLRTLPREDDSIREAGQDALAELFADLSEDDMFYGLWRRRCVYAETNAAISYEQNGMWAQAQIMYEGAQVKARTGVLNFTEAEYSLWEDHWVICAQKLQQWDILTDLAKLEGNNDLLLECAWRLSDWSTEREILEQALDSLSATSTPRRRVFEAYMALIKSQSGQDKPTEFGRICDEAIQLTLRKWHSLPTTVTQAHVPLLQIFQQFVELQEASTVFASLALTNASNLDQRSAELKTLMQTWRERLPNLWDDINAWSDLVAWRQHVFGAVNKAYLPLVPLIQQNGATGSSTNSYAYRGYHETAWIINRFAHVARKHYLNDVCISSLTKIYTLPNIEIQEAFLKLREQAKCHFQNPNELTQGLDVINNTNLMFFAAPQKAEFFTLKGMFMAKLGLNEEANHAFATAIQMDLNLAKAWTEWGRYNDRMFRDKPTDIFSAGNAVSCYLQAAGLYKNSKVRKLLIRVLWLLSCDDASGTVSQAFEGYKGEAPIWYWITFIPQLLQSLSHREAKYARRLLMQIAKTFPQALYYYLRTAKEDYVAAKRSALIAAQRAAQARQQQQQQQQQQQAAAATATNPPASASAQGGTPTQTATSTAPGTNSNTASPRPTPSAGPPSLTPQQDCTSGAQDLVKPASSSGGDAAASVQASGQVKLETGAQAQPAAEGQQSASQQPNQQVQQAQQGQQGPHAQQMQQAQPTPQGQQQPQANVPGAQPGGVPGQQRPQSAQQPGAPGMPQGPRQPWEHVDEILNILKTAFPLLALTMENMADQIQQRFKPGNDEDIYRLTNALLNDALQQYIQRASIPNDNGQLPPASMANVVRFAENLPPGALKASFEEDFVRSRPTLRDYVQKLQRWRDRYEVALDKRPSRQHLEHCSHYLVEFQHQKFDEVEVPGQYLKLEDNNSDFVKISRFMPTYEVTRSSGMCTRRLTMLSNKGSLHSFAVQLPSARYCRREEKILQLLRCLNRVLERRKETRKRGLAFHTPVAVPLSPQLRLVDNDSSFTSLQDIYEKHCEEIGIGKDDPIMAWVEKMRSTWDGTKGLVEFTNLRMELMDEISTKMVPDNILSRFMIRSMATPSDLWLMRKQFTLQMASTMFLTYVLFVSARLPSRIHISRSSGQVTMSDLVPTLNPAAPQFKSPDATPFRLSPNIQNFIGPIGVEGILTSSLMAIGRCLSEPERELEEYLSIFVCDEINFWLAGSRQAHGQTEAPRELVLQNVLEMVKRARLLSCKYEIDKPTPGTVPVSQTVLDLINSASNPSKLALQDPTWAPWL